MPASDPSFKNHLISITDFLEFYDLDDVDLLMWDLLLYAFTCEDADNWDSHRRNSMLHFYKLLLNFIKGINAIAIPMLEHFKHEIPLNLRP